LEVKKKERPPFVSKSDAIATTRRWSDKIDIMKKCGEKKEDKSMISMQTL
jgi:hypothetical protein